MYKPNPLNESLDFHWRAQVLRIAYVSPSHLFAASSAQDLDLNVAAPPLPKPTKTPVSGRTKRGLCPDVGVC